MDEKEKLIDFYYARLQAVRRARKHYLLFLIALLSVTWILYWGAAETFSAKVFGVSLSRKTLFGITPGFSTLLVLALVGSFRAARPALERLREAFKKDGASSELELEAIDTHQSWVDYVKFIWTGRFDRFLQATVLLGAMASTFTIGLKLATKFTGYATLLFTTYCLFCLAVQVATSWKWFADSNLSSGKHSPQADGKKP